MPRYGRGRSGQGRSAQGRHRRGGRLAVALTTLALAAACGADPEPGGDGKAPERPSASAGTSAGGGPSAGGGAKDPEPLSEARLTAAAFGEGEKAGPYTAGTLLVGDAPLSDAYTADPAVCQPLVSLAAGATPHDPVAEVNRDLSIAGELRSVDVTVQLRSYAAGGARAVLAALRKAGTACAGGFTEERAIAKARYLKAEPVEAPAIGDEAVAFRFTIQDVKDKDLKLYEYLTVVRSGSTTLSFRADILDTKDFGGVPREVVTAQWEKFRAAPANSA
ncbi:hypothetical protein [Streptomyces sp. NPDC051310]|uniref:hypothetical protein n=1 Tax=Streptomyces sp. NPDC051310 TaxID=3365649 RepID=UPI0037ACA762